MNRRTPVHRLAGVSRPGVVLLAALVLAAVAFVGVGPTTADPLVHRFSISDASVIEGQSGTVELKLRVSLNAAAPDQTSVAFATTGGSARPGPGLDYAERQGGVLVFPPLTTSRDITFVVQGDAHAEPPETIVVTLSDPQNASIADGEGVGTIENDDGPPPSLTVSDRSVAEGDAGVSEAVFTVSLSPASTQTVSVDYSAAAGSPAATAGTDYDLVATNPGGDPADDFTLSFPPGTTARTITVNVKGDLVDEESPERYNVVLANADNAAIQDATGAGSIVDDDAAPSVYIAEKQSPFDKDDAEVRKSEGNSGTTPYEFQVKLLDAAGNETVSGRGVQMEYLTQDGTATAANNDYQARSGTLSFGTTLSSIDVVVPVVGDTTSELNETFSVVLRDVVNGTLAGSRATGTIVNDDGGGPKVSIAAADFDPELAGNQPFPEGDTGTRPVTFKVTVDSSPIQDASVKFRTLTGTATTADFSAATGTLTWPANAPAETLEKTVTVNIFGDTLDEPNEQFSVELFEPVNLTLGATTERVGAAEIADDDAPSKLSIDSRSVTEPNTPNTTTMQFTVTLAPASGQAVTVTAATADNTATGGNNPTADYITRSASLSFSPGETVKTFDVTVNGDNDAEPNETFLVNLNNPTNADVNPERSPGVGTILNNDGPAPTVRIGDAPAVTEGNSGTVNAAFTLTRSSTSGAQAVTVRYSTEDGTAKADQGPKKFDFVGAQNQTVTFSTGSATATLNVPVNGDVADEDNEEFFVRLLGASNASLDPDPAKQVGKGTINDDDTAPLKLSVADAAAVSEPDTGTVDMTFLVSLNARPGRQVTVDFATADGTAKAPADYAARTGTLTFAPDSDPVQEVKIAVKGDLSHEPAETIVLNLSNPNSAATIEDGSGTGTITDNDPAPTASIGDTTAEEAAGKAVFTVTLSQPSGNEIKIDYATADGTGENAATQPGDYTATSGQLTFAPGDTSRTFEVPVINDTASEPAETFRATISSPDTAKAGIADGEGIATIAASDAPPPALSVSDESVVEGNSGTTTLTFDVTLDKASNETVTVKYKTRDGSATVAGNDYEAAEDTLTFTPGQTAKSVDVTVNGDTLFEGDENFLLDLSEPSNATLGDPSGQGVITNDDPAPPFRNEITTGPGGGGGPHVRSYLRPDPDQNNYEERRGFMLGNPAETFGATVARGDLYPQHPGDEIVTGTNDGPAVVRIYKANGEYIQGFEFFSGTQFSGGISVATGNLDEGEDEQGNPEGDPADEVVIGTGPGMKATVVVLDPPTGEAFALEPYGDFRGGVFVAAGDLDRDGTDDLVTGAGAGGGPHVQVLFGSGESDSFFPYPAAFSGGVRVGVGEDDDQAMLLTGAGPGGGPHVASHTYALVGGKPVRNSGDGGFYAYQCDQRACFTNGISVASGDVDGDGLLDIITGAGPGGGPHVQAFRADRSYLGGFFAYDCNPNTFPRGCFTNGVWVSHGRA